jgi:hypothetical protein
MMKDSKTPFFCSKFPWARERTFPKIIENLGTRSQKVSPALLYADSGVICRDCLVSDRDAMIVWLTLKDGIEGIAASFKVTWFASSDRVNPRKSHDLVFMPTREPVTSAEG